VYQDSQLIVLIVKQSKEFAALLKSPVVKPSKKNQIIDEVLKGKVSTLTAAFINLLVKKGRESILSEIMAEVENYYNEINQIHKIKFTTAVPISDDIKNAIVAKIKADKQIEKIVLDHVIDESIIGGFKLELGHLQIDGSIDKDLKDIKRQFHQNDYLYKIK
jgi:F-type H+-transporting ATPase subunit delta